MSVREGDKIKSILTGKVYEVKTIKDWTVGLTSLDGWSHVWTERDNLRLFYEKIEDEEGPNDCSPSAASRSLRSPAYVRLDSL